MTGRLFVAAPAKINLCLHVGKRRVDGYHDLESLVGFASFGDRLWIEPDDKLSLRVTGHFGGAVPEGEDNLVLKAARRLAPDRGARITLEKNIPTAAGLGGGSADAAAALRGLNRLWNLELGSFNLREIAASIGADVPVCIDSQPAWMEGRGERVLILPALPSLSVLLANPGVAVSTAPVFAGLRRRRGLGFPRPSGPFADLPALINYLNLTANDLEEPARVLAPVIADVLDEFSGLPGLLLARMSGSGATCFGIFVDSDKAQTALGLFQEARPDWWVIATGLSQKTNCNPHEERAA